MDLDSPPSSGGSSPSSSASLSPRDRILQKLAIFGVSEEYFEDVHPGVVCFVKNNKSLLPEIVSAILPTDMDIGEAVNEGKSGSKKALRRLNLRDQYCESMNWLKWLMFEGDPSIALKNMANSGVGGRGVCGAVWGKNDIAFRCRTCENDPTCAICVPCFQNGNHKNHDYSIIYTGGGCCDCGDETAWRPEGFCSKHKGSEQIQPLPDEIADSVGPVLDALFRSWKDKLSVAGSPSGEDSSVNDHAIEPRKVANEFSYVVVEMLLDFCNHSESLLSFISKRLINRVGLLDLLVRGERFLSSDVTKKLHELLLKLLGEPIFKYEFAKVFIDYYSVPVGEVLRASSDTVLKKYPLLSMFSVQIFTVPTLTPRLVKDRGLLVVLLECLGEILYFCCDTDGQFQFNKWFGVFDTCVRVLEDIRFVLSHSAVAKYVTHERSDLVKAWLQILSLVQGMNPQKRETGIHVEEEIENAHLPFLMCNSIANIHLLLVKGAFSVAGSDEMDQEASFENEREDTEDSDKFSQRHTKVGRVSEESSVCSSAAYSNVFDSVAEKFDDDNHFSILPSVLKLTFEALRAIYCWLAQSNIVATGTSGVSRSNLLAFKEALLTVKKGKYISQPYDGSLMMNEHSHLIVESLPSGDLKEQHGTMACPMDTGDMQSDASAMDTETSTDKDMLSLLSSYEWPDIHYDVSTHEISLHMPLHGLLGLILKEALRHYCGESVVTDKSGFSYRNRLSNYHDFFRKILRGCHPYGFSSYMMEHPLQSRVFCSQVRAGMWRRNGDAAMLCFEWYRSIRWSYHELELDLFLLQLCAASAPADLYVKRLVERFQLSNYLAFDLKRSSEHEPVLMQELLTLIIQIVKERRFCGLTASENLQRELVCKLATGDATHSQLVKSLPRDLSKLDQLQEVLDRIAQYSNPSGMNQGKYSLRLPYWKELDLYHPCWNPRDLQVAEERYSRFHGVSALGAQMPKWTNIYQPLLGIAGIATCETVLQIVRAVVFYAVVTDKSVESRAPDGVLIAALHLLSLSLDICSIERKSDDLSLHGGDGIPLLAVACEEIGAEMQNEYGRHSLLSLLVLLMKMHKKENSDTFTEAGNFSLASLVENLLKRFAEVDTNCFTKLQQFAPDIVSSQADEAVKFSSASDTDKRKLKARERQAAILAKMRAEQSKFIASLKSSGDTGSDESLVEKEDHASDAARDSEETHICSLCHDPNSKNPVSFLILLQKSRLVNFVERGPPSWDQTCVSGGSESSLQASQMTNPPVMHTNTIYVEKLSSTQLAHLVEGAIDEFSSQAHPAEINAYIDFLKFQFPEQRIYSVPAKSSDKRAKTAYSLESLEQDMFVSISKELRRITDESDSIRDIEASSGQEATSCRDISLLLGKYLASLTKDSKENSITRRVESTGKIPSYDGFGPSDCEGIHVSSCGHAVHQGCLDRYLSSLKERYTRRMVFEGGHIVDPDQGEFLCPVCRRLANSTLPAVLDDSHKFRGQPIELAISSEHSSGSLTSLEVETRSLRFQYALSILQTAASMVSRGETLKALPLHRNKRIRPNLEPIIQVLSGMYFSEKQDLFSRAGRVSPSVLLWDTLKYSLVSTEIAARCGKSCLAARRGLTSLYSEFRSSGGFILPLLLRVTDSTRSKSLPDVLLRFRGLQLFASSICFGATSGESYRGASVEKGKIVSILKHINSEMTYPDTQFWDQASEPVLARDPFSTLMWILFCLPQPFLSSKESFLSLVHIFYGVSVCQAMLTYFSYSQCNVSDIGFHDCLVSDIAKLAGDSVISKQFFVSNYVDVSRPIKDVIEKLSLPFLRRCSLLWKLLKSSSASPFPSMAEDLEKSLDVSSHQQGSGILGDSDEICVLYNMFEIPSLDVVLKDKTLRSTMSKWFHHFAEVFDDRSIERGLHMTPAAPFQLMHLPVVYQDLVQRYIKARCSLCKAVQDEPALCLLCGRLCSPAWKPCCRESGCQAHAVSCGAGTGVFLLVRKTTILLQRNARQATWPSPYLDAFGEEDTDMQRGKPLFLNEERYAALTYMVASHGLERSSKVLRETRIGTFFLV